MNRIALTVLALTSLGALTAGCGDPSGLHAEGNITLTVHQTGQADGPATFNLPADTYIDPPPGIGRGFYGSCARVGTRWTVDLSRADSVQTGLRRVQFAVNEGTASGAVTAKFTLGTTEYDGAARCTVSAVSAEEKGVRLTVQCTNVSSTVDPRTFDGMGTLTLRNCDVR